MERPAKRGVFVFGAALSARARLLVANLETIGPRRANDEIRKFAAVRVIVAGAIKVGQRLAADLGPGEKPSDRIVVVNLSGRGDKDVATAAEYFDLLPDDSAEQEIAQEGEQL